MKVHYDALALRRRQESEEQAPDKMELITTLRDLCGQNGLPEQNKIARALEIIRKDVDLETRCRGKAALHFGCAYLDS